MTIAFYMDVQLRITIGRCVQDLELIAKAADAEELANRVEYLPL